MIAVCVFSCSHNEKAEVTKDEGAKYLKVEPRGGYTRIEIANPWQKGELLGAYNLVHRDSVVPEGMPDGQLIRIPIESAVAYSSVHAEGLREMNAESTIRGVTGAGYFTQPEMLRRIEAGNVQSLGSAESPDIERMLMLKPDAVLLNVYQGAEMGGVERSGLPIIKMVDNMEDSPLGKAEWIRLYGALTGQLEMADSIYNAVKKVYGQLSEKALKSHEKPRVMTENMYQGVWYVSGGQSYQARLIADASGDYLWKDDSHNGSLNLTFEEVLERAHDADVWLMRLFGQDITKRSLSAENERYAMFRPYKEQNIFYCNTAVNDIFALSAFHPEVLLSEYVAIFHPELGVKSKYFKRITD